MFKTYMYRNVGEICTLVFLRYASGQTYKQTERQRNRHTDWNTLHPTEGKVMKKDTTATYSGSCLHHLYWICNDCSNQL